MRQSTTGFLIIALFMGIVGGYVGAKYFAGRGEEKVVKETAYERVMRTGTLRCGYVVEPPHIIKDAATGAVTGVIADIMNEAGRLLNIKIDWAEEVGWGSTVESIRSGRVDAICVNFWMNPAEGKYLGYSMPLYYGILAGYVRADDHRFDNNMQAINDSSVMISTIDGDLAGIFARQEFPKAKQVSLPNMTDQSSNIMNVMTGKADVAFTDAMIGVRFIENNPGKVRNLSPDHPLRAFPATIALPQTDIALKTMLDSAFVQLLYSGYVDKALDKYDVPADGAFRVRKPYVTPSEARPLLSGTNESVKSQPTQ